MRTGFLVLSALLCIATPVKASGDDFADPEFWQAALDASEENFLQAVQNVGLQDALTTWQTQFDAEEATHKRSINAAVCRYFFTLRGYYIGAQDWSNADVVNQYLPSGCCTYFDRYYSCNANSGPVVGLDFNDYANACDACPAGVHFSGTFAAQRKSTNINCYDLDVASGARLACLSQSLQTTVGAVNIGLQPADTNPPAFAPCTAADNSYRRYDGSCNSMSIPYSGMTGGKITRHSTQYKTDNEANWFLNGPNPRDVSVQVMHQDTFHPNSVNANTLAVGWVNFFIHDFFDQTFDWQDQIAVPLSNDDPDWYCSNDGGFFEHDNDESNGRYLLVPRILPTTSTADSARREYRNLVTSWFDASQVYGSSTAQGQALRDGPYLKMVGSGDFEFPPDRPAPNWHDRDAGFITGDYRSNNHVGLLAMHVIWAREHNNLVNQLKVQYPAQANDEDFLFGTARNILAAEMIKVQTLEWSTALVQDWPSTQILIGIWQQFGQAYPYQSVMTHTVPEDFIAAYKFHTMVPPTITVKDSNNNDVVVDYLDTFQNSTALRVHGLSKIVGGLGRSVCGAFQHHNYAPKMRNLRNPQHVVKQNVLSPRNCQKIDGFDMAVTDILRDREKAIPSYNDFRRILGYNAVGPANYVLKPAQYFCDVAQAPSDALALARLYSWDIESVDFIVGQLGEYRSPYEGFPTTSTSGFLPFVYDRAKLDRFFTSNFDAAHYTQWGLDRIRGPNVLVNPFGGITFAQIMTEVGVTGVPTTPFNGQPNTNIFTTYAWA
jgi:hypothetical protein